MGSSASVVPLDPSASTVADDLETLALVQREYQRLQRNGGNKGTTRSVGDPVGDGDGDGDGSIQTTDEELFLHLRQVVAQRYGNRVAVVAADGNGEPIAPPAAKQHEQEQENHLDAPTNGDKEHPSVSKELDLDVGMTVEDDDDVGPHLSDADLADAEKATAIALGPGLNDIREHEHENIDMDEPVMPFNESTEDHPDHGRIKITGSASVPSMSSLISHQNAASSEAHRPLHGHGHGNSKSSFDLSQNLTPVFTTDVLTDPTTLKMLTRFAANKQVPHGVDRIRFWVEIDELQQLPSHSYTNRRLRKIYDKFLSPEAQSPVCVTAAMLAEIEAALEGENISAGIYTDAQAICFTALERSVFPRFRDSAMFTKMRDMCAAHGVVLSGSHANASGNGNGAGNGANNGHAGSDGSGDLDGDFSLMGVLGHPAKLRFLKSYCMEAVALENLLFYLEVEDCKRLPNLSFIANKTRKVYDRYCVPSSRNYINLPELERVVSNDDDSLETSGGGSNTGLVSPLAELHAAAAQKLPLLPKLFYEAQLRTFASISEEIWRSFCRTPEYLEHSRNVKPTRHYSASAASSSSSSSSSATSVYASGKSRGARFLALSESNESLKNRLEAMNEFQLIERAMHYPVVKLIPAAFRADATTNAVVMDAVAASSQDTQLTPSEQLNLLLGDAFGKKYFKQFMKKRGVDHFLAFCEEVEDFKLLPGIEFLQHSAKKIYRKYIISTAKLQVDMSTAMRTEIAERLVNPTVDMFKRISQRVRHGMLQDSMPRFVKSAQYSELKKQIRQGKEAALDADCRAMEATLAKTGKLELAHLDALLQHQLGMRQFRLFLESQHCVENLMLWEDIEHFRRLPSYQIVIRSAKKIYDKYLNRASSRNSVVPLSDALYARVCSQLEVASRTTFDEVELECYDTMRNVVMPDFLDSRIFMALVGTWATVDEDYPTEMLRGEFEMAFLRHRFHLVQETRGLSRDTSTPLAEKHTMHTSNGAT